MKEASAGQSIKVTVDEAEKFLSDPKKVSDKECLETILRTISNRSEPKNLIESLIVRLGNKDSITMYGRQVNDRLTDDTASGRRRYDLHPYGKTGSGTAVMAAYQDEKGDTHVLLGRKYLDLRDKSKGLTDRYILIGGYMHPYPLEGGEENVEKLDSETKDLAEELLLKGANGYESVQAKSDKTVAVANKSNYDYNLKECAMRELNEESGLSVSSETKTYSVGINSNYAISNDKRLHTIVEEYLVDYGIQKQAPLTKPGSDIAELVWVKVKDISKDPSKPVQLHASNDSRYQVKIGSALYKIRDVDGTVIEDGLRKLREIQLENLGSSIANVQFIATTLEAGSNLQPGTLLPKKPLSEIGEEAENYHQQCLKIATNFGKALTKLAPSLLGAISLGVDKDTQSKTWAKGM